MGEEQQQNEPRPGEIPEPREKSWDEEPADPYEGVDRRDPFEGRPPTTVVQPEEPPIEYRGGPTAGEPVPPGQPLPRSSDTGSFGRET